MTDGSVGVAILGTAHTAHAWSYPLESATALSMRPG